ncbi:phosphatase PAP2 family protein [Galbitalea soli]|uniref:Phosphatase PAP2 family protein n=1 Tax=Galbitalea soli TaxID=1268042 RepID=A0A7C9TRP6_9MICO|nr:phosphatase PAP2 family protein [Galbitalea soli]NEM91839.1 phosphatase PAP2 family protein [Galbitalea soli]NYJ29327.1 undecaprenyl-diphosphatase [Galbitalea soli]
MTATTEDAGRLRRFHEKFMVEERRMPASAKRRLYLWSIILVAVGLVAFIVILTSVLGKDDLSVIDQPIESFMRTLRTPTLTTVMITVAIVFGPIALPIIILVTVLLWGFLAKHAWRPVLLAAGTLTGVIIVQILAPIIGRHRPPIQYMLFGVDHTSSFPSGHVMGACDFLLITTYLVFSRRQHIASTVTGFLVAIVLIALAVVCRVYLGYHWPTDALASVSLSLIVLGGVIALDTRRTAVVDPSLGS